MTLPVSLAPDAIARWLERVPLAADMNVDYVGMAYAVRDLLRSKVTEAVWAGADNVGGDMDREGAESTIDGVIGRYPTDAKGDA